MCGDVAKIGVWSCRYVNAINVATVLSFPGFLLYIKLGFAAAEPEGKADFFS
jgi:hypothetical protein